jgi:hypothetical protein
MGWRSYGAGLDSLPNRQGFVDSPSPSVGGRVHPAEPRSVSTAKQEHVTKEQEEQARKSAKNQALFRDANERIEELVEEVWHPAFLCECGGEHYYERLELSLAEYESIRASPIHFPVKVGNDYPEFERVVALSDGYAVVEKIGAEAEVAKELDPRSRLRGASWVEVENGPS